MPLDFLFFISSEEQLMKIVCQSFTTEYDTVTYWEASEKEILKYSVLPVIEYNKICELGKFSIYWHFINSSIDYLP